MEEPNWENFQERKIFTPETAQNVEGHWKVKGRAFLRVIPIVGEKSKQNVRAI